MMFHRSLFIYAAYVSAFAIFLTGCGPNAETGLDNSQPATPSAPLRVLVVDDEPLAKELSRQWAARSDDDVNVRDATSAELADAKRLGADVVIYPSAMIGTLAEKRMISPLSDEVTKSAELARHDIFELQRNQETAWGTKPYAVSLGSPQWMLLYRTDIFENLSIAPPATWAEYQALSKRLAKTDELENHRPADSSSWRGTIEPTGAGWSSYLLLARAAAYARHRSQYSTLFEYRTMQPLIATPPFVRALDELIEIAKTSAVANELSPTDVHREIVSGRAAMGIGWPARSVKLDDDANRFPVGLAELPGSMDVYSSRDKAWHKREQEEPKHVPLLAISGRLGSVTSETSDAAAAGRLLAWFCGPEMGGQISPASEATTIYRQSQLSILQRWIDEPDSNAAKQFAEVLEQAQNSRAWLFALRIPGRDEYLLALNNAVQKSINGEATAQHALSEAAEEWTAITERLGRESQQQAYQRSLGLD